MTLASYALVLVIVGMLALPLAVLAMDAVMIALGLETVTDVVVRVTRRWPILIFLVGLYVGLVCGILAGHWWFPC